MTLFGTVHQMPVGVTKMMDKSWAPAFRHLVFEKIDERRYAELYSTIESRPNFPVNIWVGLEITKWMFDYTDQELLEQFHFNLLTAYALGLENLGEVKLRVRGLEKVRNSVILMAIGINFGRLWAYFLENNPASALFLTFVVLLLAFLTKSLVEESTELDFGVA